MKKIAIASASLALAAMPVVGVFADDVTTQVDTLEITIDKVCSIGYTDSETTHVVNVEGVKHTDGDGTWALAGSTAADPADPATDTLSKTMSTGTTAENLGTTKLGIYCNHENGYKITASGAAALSGTYGGSAITDTIAINASFSASASGWSYKVAAGDSNRGSVQGDHANWATAANANEIIAQSPSSAPKTTTNDGDFYTITYGVGIDNTQSAGTYTGSITYTLAQL